MIPIRIDRTCTHCGYRTALTGTSTASILQAIETEHDTQRPECDAALHRKATDESR